MRHAEIVGRIEDETGVTPSPEDPRLGITFYELQLMFPWDYVHHQLVMRKLLEQKAIILLPNGKYGMPEEWF